jgi:hypothetical protein
MKARLVLLVAAAFAALAVTGCGSGGDSSSDPASLAPEKSPLYIEATVQPQGEVKENIETLFARISGIDTPPGELIISELESSADSSGEELDFDKEVKPWLGEKAGLSFQSYDGDDFTGYGVAVATTDPDAARSFVDEKAKSSDDPVEDGSYEGSDFKVESDDGTTVGVIGDFLAIAEDEATFKAMVDASEGQSLAEEDVFAEAIDAAPSGSAADLFVDIGGLIDQSGGTIDPEARQFLDSAGIEAEDATAVASLIPGSDQVEIDFSGDLGGETPPSGDASHLLSVLPYDSVAAFASTDFGKRFGEALDQIDANGIPGEVPPHEFKSTLEKAGIDVDRIAASIGDLGVFLEGESISSLNAGAVLITKDAKEARNTVANIGLLLRAGGTPGVTALGGNAAGFSVRGPDLGPKPLIVAAQEDRIVISYGRAPVVKLQAWEIPPTLADNTVYKEAVAALGGTPISAFVNGPLAVRFASIFVPADDQDFREATPYLNRIAYVAIGAGSEGDRATAKLIAGIVK